MNNVLKLKKIMSDPILWIQTFCKIVNKDGKEVPFVLNEEQRDFVINKGNMDIILKARQIGFSVLCDALSLYYCCTIPNIHCMLASYTQDSANTIYDKLKQIYYSIPVSVRPAELQNNRKELALANGSKITVTTIGNRDISRGSSLFFCHISEFAFVESVRAKKQLVAIEQSMLPSIKRGKYTYGGIVIESTANGLNHFYELYNKAENHENTYKAHFYSWITDYVMHAKEQQEYEQKYISQYGHALSCDELTPTEQTYHDNGASLRMIMWARLKRANIGDLFVQEYPAFSTEAFISTGATVFNVQKVQLDYNSKKALQPLTTISSIPSDLKIYLRNYLKIWNLPESGTKYYIGCDSAEGMGGSYDYTVISIYDEDAEQVGEFRANTVKPFDIALILNDLGLWYNRANIIVEAMSTGTVILDRLRTLYHYQNLYKYKDKINGGKKKLGYPETPKTKVQLINDFVEWYENGDMCVKSLAALNEMKTYIFDGSSTNAIDGQHDDCVVSNALVVQAIKNHVNYLWI